jgi:putative phosphoesterase
LFVSYREFTVGLISDTHGLLRPEAITALAGSDYIIHAGDIGRAEILEQLSAIAPTTAVRGNNDNDAWASRIPETEILRVGTAIIYVIHDIAALDLDPGAAGFHAVIAGHSHHPSIELREGVLFVNPGSAGPRRFRLPVSVGCLTVSGTSIKPRLVELTVGGNARRLTCRA